MKSIREANVTGKRVLVRCDLDVPIRLTAGSRQLIAVVDDFRIRACLPTLEYLINEGAKVVICGHLGRPGGKVVPELRLDPVAEVLGRCFGEPRLNLCRFHHSELGSESDGNRPILKQVQDDGGQVQSLISTRLVLGLPRTRFGDGESAGILFQESENPAREGGDEAVEHGAEGAQGGTKTSGVSPRFLLLENLRFHPGEKANDPEFAGELAGLADIYVNECFATSHRAHASIVGVPKLLPAYGGLRLEEEVETLSKVREDPVRPLVFVMGGAKTETKVPLVRKISKYADRILLGGRLMFEKSLENVPNVVFPVDDVDGFDIGPETIELFKEILVEAGTVVWNGPLGKFESADYADGTKEIASFLTQISADIVVGGGDTVAALKQFGLRDKIGFVSTGGGAMLAFLAGEHLLGIEVLKHRN